jgi:hypothetical protein
LASSKVPLELIIITHIYNLQFAKGPSHLVPISSASQRRRMLAFLLVCGFQSHVALGMVREDSDEEAS